VQKIEVKSINGVSGDYLIYYENEKTGISAKQYLAFYTILCCLHDTESPLAKRAFLSANSGFVSVERILDIHSDRFSLLQISISP
jgi:hypothetical protein